MSEHSDDAPDPTTRDIPSQLPARRDVAEIDCTGLARAIELLASGGLRGDALIALLRHELATVQRHAHRTTNLLQDASVELRQLRESAEREQILKQDEHRQLQDHNDRFVANLMQEHDAELASLRRERDAAMDRVRDLSRGITRVGSTSSASLQRVSLSSPTRSARPPVEIAELRARIDELLYERERSLRLLRQLAEQRDLAESRLQSTLASLGQGQANALPHPFPGESLGTDPQAVSDAFGRPALARESFENPTASPGTRRTPTLPSGPDVADANLGDLEDPDAWDVDGEPGISAALTNAASTNVVEPLARPAHSGATGHLMSALPKNAPARTERVGSYTMRADELVVESVFVPRGSPHPSKNS